MPSTIIMSTLALAFSYYQLYFNKIDTERRRIYDLRFQSISNFNREGRDVMEIFNYYRSQNEFDINNLLAQTVNKINRLKISTALSIDLLFNEIVDKEEYKLYKESLDNIVKETDALKMREVLTKQTNKDRDLHIRIWNNNMEKLIIDFYKCEENLYNVFKEYL